MTLPSRAPDSSDEPVPPFEIVRPARLSTPVIFASPHSGRLYPAEMMAASRLDERSIRQSEDAYVDELIGPAAELGVPLVLARYARVFVDVNRGSEELDPDMFEDEPAGAGPARSARVAAGLGSIPRVVSEGREIYAGKLPRGEADRRLAAVWRPYHAALDALIGEARDAFGFALLVDWHSMPAAAARAGRTRGGRVPDFVLGDRFGSSCSGAVTSAAHRELEAKGYAVVRNMPYAGGWTTERYGRPPEGLHALQIEINRGLYLDEARLRPTDGLPSLKRDLHRLAGVLAALRLPAAPPQT